MSILDRARTTLANRLLTAIARRLRDQRGFLMIEVIVAAGLMIVVLSASLLTFELLLTNQSSGSVRFDSQDRARVAMDRLARDLRNVAGASTGATEIDQAGPYDLIFRTVNPTGPASGQNPTNIERVRFCIDNTNPASEVLWYQVMPMTDPSTPAFPGAQNANVPTACPDQTTGAWSSATKLDYADAITNQIGSQNRPAFSYTSQNGAIVAVHAELYVNAKPTGAASETHLSSGVFLRNQDVPPTAAFTATAGTGYITLDGSASVDPGGQQLTYVWFDGTTKIGQGIVFGYTHTPNPNCPAQQSQCVPLPSGSSHSISLHVFDPAGLEGDAPAQTVVVQ